MLEKIFKFYFKGTDEYTNYVKNNDKVIDVLQNRRNLTSPSQVEIIGSMEKVLDAKLVMKDQQKLIEKILVSMKARKAKMEFDVFIWKQEMKLRFEIDEKDYINDYKEEVGKKSLTIEDKKILFRNKYKDVYVKNNNAMILMNEYIETLENERGDILDTKRNLSDYLEILKRINY